jgi:hypothetical protein
VAFGNKYTCNNRISVEEVFYVVRLVSYIPYAVEGKFWSRKSRIWLWESVAPTMRHPIFAKVGTNISNSGGRSVGIACSQTKATEFSFSFFFS